MRARHELALALWQEGAREEAVTHYRELLRLNPNDNQGIRYLLLDALLELGHDGDAEALFRRYKDDASAAWMWSGALLAFRKSGDTAQSRKALAKAQRANPFLLTYLTGRTPLPLSMPDYVGMGDTNEAVAYAFEAGGAWAAASGAIAWLKTALPGGSTSIAKPAAAAGEPESEDPETARIDEAVLALLLLGLHDGDRAWKTFDWAALSRLHHKGLISNPVGKTKSVELTESGLAAAKALYEALFVKPQ